MRDHDARDPFTNTCLFCYGKYGVQPETAMSPEGPMNGYPFDLLARVAAHLGLILPGDDLIEAATKLLDDINWPNYPMEKL